MKHKLPKRLRNKKRNPYILESFPGITFTVLESKGCRADRLPPYKEYNPNKIHVARRRRAWKDHTSFPRGWRWEQEETGNINILDPTDDFEDVK